MEQVVSILTILYCSLTTVAFILVCDKPVKQNEEFRKRLNFKVAEISCLKSKEDKAFETLNSLDFSIIQANKVLRRNVHGVEADLRRLFKDLQGYEVVRERISPRFEKVEVLRTGGSCDLVHSVFVMSPVDESVLTPKDKELRKLVAELDLSLEQPHEFYK